MEGVLSYVTSGYRLEFIFNFFYFLNIAFNMYLYFTSSYHPKGIG